MGIKAYQCPQCGGMINPVTLRCDFCGAQYERDQHMLNPYTVEVVRGNVQQLVAQRRLNDYILKETDDKVGYLEYNLHALARDLAENIIPCMEVRSWKDMESMTTVLAGRLKVVEPNERFRMQDWRI